ncbi:MAG TPA: LLM class flavin-dependent oxidoreductase [Baekduia sp.]|nr:LLM class flavin-dependent oxidoreductase [Baekduia sp.]
MLRLSVLDQSPVKEGSTGSAALQDTLDLAMLADALGYTRYWVAEHHGGPMLAGPSPEVLIGPIASVTQRIRVGSGGVMLPHYSPLKVAESFSVLAGLFPERIDLGLGRASGTDALTTYALQRDRRDAAPDDFPQQLVELLAYLNGTFPEGHRFARLAELPGRPETPEPWLLGSSPQSAIWAAQLGLPYAFADFISPDGAAITTDYRARFVPSERHRDPQTTVAAWVLAADSEEEARFLATSSRMAFKMLRRGRLIAVPPPEKAVRFLESEGEALAEADPPIARGRRTIVGAPDKVRAQVEQLAADYGADEVVVVTITYDHAARRRSYELLADAFDLRHAQPAVGVHQPG